MKYRTSNETQNEPTIWLFWPFLPCSEFREDQSASQKRQNQLK